MFIAGTECSNVANTGERSSHAVYAADFTRTKLLQFETQSVCAYAARTHLFSNSHHTFVCILSHLCTECKNVALGGVDTSFFSLFSTKKCTFLLFFGYFCTFLIYIAYFCGAATVGSGLRALFNCFLVVFMLKYQGGHGV